MIKFLKHIWRYLTSPTYRFWVGFYNEQAIINRMKSEWEESKRRQSYRTSYGIKKMKNLNKTL